MNWDSLINRFPRSLTLLLLATGLVLSSLTPAVAGDPSLAKEPLFVPGELLVKFKAGTTRSSRSSSRKAINGQLIRTLPMLGVEHWRLPEGASVNKAVTALRSSGQIEYAEPNARRYPRVLPNDPEFGRQWGLNNTGQIIADPVASVLVGLVGADMALPAAWDVTTGSTTTTVAVIDDSIDVNHPDLAANIRKNPIELGGIAGIDDDANGYTDDITGWDFVENDADTSRNGALASEGHGTLVSGTLGAVGNNGTGIAGASWNVGIIPIKFGFDVVSEVDAINYAIQQGAKIVNASWGGPLFSQTAADAINQLQANNILLVVAAGNSGLDHDAMADFPADYASGNHIISVSATGPTDAVNWSDYGATAVDVAAPGESVYTTMPLTGSSQWGNTRTTGINYDYNQGTSFSAPYVAGIAALVESQFPNSGYANLKGRLMAGVEPLNGQTALLATDGRINAANALTIAPEPVITVKTVTVDDSVTGNNNGVLDPGESVSLRVTLENAWQAATGISATLVSNHPDVTIDTSSASFVSLAQEASGGVGPTVTPLGITLAASATAGERLLFTLQLTATGGYAATRHFAITVANPLSNGSTVIGTIGADISDTVHHYTIVVPTGASQLTVTTSTANNQDIGIVISSTLPAVLGGSGQTAIGDSSFGGNEQAVINFPTAGLFHVLIHSFEFPGPGRTFDYTLQATATSNAPSLIPGIDPFTILLGNVLDFTFADLLNNDSAPGTSPTINISSVSPITQAGGSVALTIAHTNPALATYTYTPPAGFLGEDRFTYELNSGSSTKVGVVSIRVVAGTSPSHINDAGGCQVGPTGEGGAILPLMLLAALAYGFRRKYNS